MNEHYLVKVPVVALENKDGDRAPIFVATGSKLGVVGPAKDDSRFLVVEVAGRQLEVFRPHLMTRCIAGAAMQ